jgi:hypothetical protein
MSIAENITREDYSTRGGGVELDLTAFGYEDEFLSAYQSQTPPACRWLD